MQRLTGSGAALRVLATALFVMTGCEENESIVIYTCGNQECEPGEDELNCPADCPPACRDGTCGTQQDVSGVNGQVVARAMAGLRVDAQPHLEWG